MKIEFTGRQTEVPTGARAWPSASSRKLAASAARHHPRPRHPRPPDKHRAASPEVERSHSPRSRPDAPAGGRRPTCAASRSATVIDKLSRQAQRRAGERPRQPRTAVRRRPGASAARAAIGAGAKPRQRPESAPGRPAPARFRARTSEVALPQAALDPSSHAVWPVARAAGARGPARPAAQGRGRARGARHEIRLPRVQRPGPRAHGLHRLHPLRPGADRRQQRARLPAQARRRASAARSSRKLCRCRICCFVVTKGLTPPRELLRRGGGARHPRAHDRRSSRRRSSSSSRRCSRSAWPRGCTCTACCWTFSASAC